MQVGVLARNDYPECAPFDGIGAVESRLLENGFLIVRDAGNYVGILTPHDVVERPRRLVADCLGQIPAVQAEADIETVLARMKQENYAILPVFQGDAFCGVVTRRQIVEHLWGFQRKLQEAVDRAMAELRERNARLQVEIMKRQAAEEALQAARDRLEQQVVEREARLADTMQTHIATLNMMEDAVEARQRLETVNDTLIREIAERKQIEEDLRAAERLYRTVVEQIPGITYITTVSESPQLLYISPQGESIFGYSPAECKANPDVWMSRIHPEDRDRVETWLREFTTGGGPCEIDYRIYARDGRIRWFRDRATAVKDERGGVAYCHGVCFDVTAHREAEAALRTSEEMFRSVTETAREAILSYDSEGAIFLWNEAAERMFAYSKEEALGQPVKILIAGGYLKKFLRDVEQSGGSEGAPGTGKLVETTCTRKDGSEFPAEISGAAWTSDGRSFHTLVVRDVTERLRLEGEILEIAHRERRKIGHDLHDDLGQRLTGIRLLCNSLEGKVANISAESAAMVREMASLLDEGLEQVRALAKGLLPVAPTADGLMAALENLADQTQRATGIWCEFLREAPVLVPDDGTAANLYRIAQEAVSNAVRHGRPALVEVRLELAQRMLQLTVKDNGAGFLPHTPPAAGRGLDIMAFRTKAMRGSLDIQSKPGKGTVVTCWCPLHPAGNRERHDKE